MGLFLKQIDFTRVLTDDQVYDHMMKNYEKLGRDWVVHQWSWMNNVYQAFNDHYKYLIVISLVEKTLQFYDQMNINYTFDDFYSKSNLQIEKFSITELCEKLLLPIDRSAFSQVKPDNQIRTTSKYIKKVSEIFNKEKIYLKNNDLKFIENIIKKNFSICWRWFYRMQIPLIIGYHEMFEDVASFHLWGTVAMNQVLNYQKNIGSSNVTSLTPDYMEFNKSIIEGVGRSTGISAMSISEMTNIPRATVIRKCKYLVKNSFLQLNNKKQYMLTGYNATRVLPYQKKVFRNKAKFLRKVLNLLTIS